MLKLTKKQVNAVVTAASAVLTRKIDEELKNVLFVPSGVDHLEAMSTNGTETIGIQIDAALEESITVPLNALTSYKAAKPEEDFYAYFDGNCVYCGPESDMAEYPEASSDATKPAGINLFDFNVKTFLSTVRGLDWGIPKKDPMLYFSDQGVYVGSGLNLVWGYVAGLPESIPFGNVPLTRVLLKKMPTRGSGKIGYGPGGDILYLEVGKYWYSVKFAIIDRTDIIETLALYVPGYKTTLVFTDPQKQAQELREVLAAFPAGSSDHAALSAGKRASMVTVLLEGRPVGFPLDVLTEGESYTRPVVSLTLIVNALDAGLTELCFGNDPSQPLVFSHADTACVIMPITPGTYSPEDKILVGGA